MSSNAATVFQPPARSVPRPRVSGATLFFAVIAAPPALFYFGLSSSNTLGATLVALVLLALRLRPTIAVHDLKPLSDGRVYRATFAILSLIVLHFALAASVVPTDVLRATASLVPMTLLLLAGGALANAFLCVPAAYLHSGLVRCFLLLCALALIGATGWGPPSLAEEWRRPVFPFSEPSMFALAFIPAFMYVCVAAKGLAKMGFLFIGLACTVFIQSLTLAAGCLLVAVVSLRTTTLLVLAVPFAFSVAQLDLGYYSDRLDLSGEVQNLSNLVYIQGWQMIGESLQRSGGIGLGFQQLGVHGTEVAAAEVLRALREGEDLNVLDGGFVFAKLGSEFGVLGSLLGLAFLVVAARSIVTLRSMAANCRRVLPLVTLSHCVVVAYLVELFVRGPGYFGGTSLLLLAALWLLKQQRRATYPKVTGVERSVRPASLA